MSPATVDVYGRMLNGMNGVDSRVNGFRESKVDTLHPHDHVHFDQSLKPKSYTIKGTSPNSKILFQDVNILDSTGKPRFNGDVYVEGERIHSVGTVPRKAELVKDPNVKVIQGRGRTLMSGLGDAHTHFSWNNGDLGRLGELGVEEHTLHTARSAQTYLDSGYTMCFGAASAKERLDCVVRDAINEGSLPGPRYLANGKEMAVPDGELVPGITAFARGPLEMRETIRHHIKIGVDQIKLSMSGEQITETRDAQDCYFSDEETAACVDEAHRHGIRLCAHARARDSVKQCVRHGVDVIYHASWIDQEGMDMLEKNKHKHVVAPGINWLIATIYEAGEFGYSFEIADQVGYSAELEAAILGLKEMHRRGITVLPGGDYGFAWTPHGTYARDLEHFVKLLDFTPMESIVAATAGVAKLFMREDELGKVLPGYLADLILVNGDPLEEISVLQHHDKLDVIIINGRIHKASYKEVAMTKDLPSILQPAIDRMQNFVAYALEDGTNRTRIGHLDFEKDTITPLSFVSGTPVETLYQVLEVGHDQVIASGPPFDYKESGVRLLPPFSARDVLAVGKNYSAHAKEFNKSGYDASDKVDIPSHPVIFTKRSTSIIATEEEILPLENFTQSCDYEGEIGVIIGKPGYQISEAEANEYVFGYTIINDVTAREKQRDHKQFYIGKSADTYCPMGPVAVPASALPQKLTVTTRVNGEKRQEGTTDDLIFSIPNLIKTLSESQTLRAGDVIATGTPAGVGFGLDPPTFLKPGDTIEISVTGLGTLHNTIAKPDSKNMVSERVISETVLPIHNISATMGGLGLERLPSGKRVNARRIGNGPHTIVFIHGLGGNMSYYAPLVSKLGLEQGERESKYTCLLYDLEGHGMTPTEATSLVTIESLSQDLEEILHLPSLGLPLQQGMTLVAHSMGCLITELFASQHSDLVTNMILIGPPPCPLSNAGAEGAINRAVTVRAEGTRNVAIAVAAAGTSARTKSTNQLALAAVQMSLILTDPESYAKGCTALASGRDLKVEPAKLKHRTLIVAGDEDKVSPPSYVKDLAAKMENCKLEILSGVGHWHCFEDSSGVAKAIQDFLFEL